MEIFSTNEHKAKKAQTWSNSTQALVCCWCDDIRMLEWSRYNLGRHQAAYMRHVWQQMRVYRVTNLAESRLNNSIKYIHKFIKKKLYI